MNYVNDESLGNTHSCQDNHESGETLHVDIM